MLPSQSLYVPLSLLCVLLSLRAAVPSPLAFVFVAVAVVLAPRVQRDALACSAILSSAFEKIPVSLHLTHREPLTPIGPVGRGQPRPETIS